MLERVVHFEKFTLLSWMSIITHLILLKRFKILYLISLHLGNIYILCLVACEDDINPYLIYGNYCLASLNGVFEYNKIHGACKSSKPTIYTEETRNYVIDAAKNYFLGGGIFMNLIRNGPM